MGDIVKSTLLSAFTVALLATPAGAQGVEWQGDYATALKKASERGKPVLVYFWGKQ